MSPAPELLRQGTQRRGNGFTIGFIGSKLRTSEAGGGIAVRLGISGAESRVGFALTTVELAAGESASLPGGGQLRVIDIFVSPDGTETAAAIEVTGEAASAEASA